jgi:hypothetical protein
MTPSHFCDYLPFEEDLALHLNNLESPLHKDDLYKVLLKLGSWFWRRFFFFNMNTCKYGFPYCSPSIPLGTMIWTNLIYIVSESFHINMSPSGSVVLEKIFKWPQPIFVIISPLKRTLPLICTILNSLYKFFYCNFRVARKYELFITTFEMPPMKQNASWPYTFIDLTYQGLISKFEWIFYCWNKLGLPSLRRILPETKFFFLEGWGGGLLGQWQDTSYSFLAFASCASSDKKLSQDQQDDQ